MNTSFRKVYSGVAPKHKMFALLNSYSDAPFDADRISGKRSVGEWFETDAQSHDYMLNILPPLFMRSGMFAVSEFLTGSITSVFLCLSIDGDLRYFHDYCDLSDGSSPDRLKAAILDRESHPVPAMSRRERLDHIWNTTHTDYRGFAGERWPQDKRGQRTVLVYNKKNGTVLKLLDDLSEAEISAKLPIELRFLPDLADAA